MFDLVVWGPAALHYCAALQSFRLHEHELPGGLTLEDRKDEVTTKLGESRKGTNRQPNSRFALFAMGQRLT